MKSGQAEFKFSSKTKATFLNIINNHQWHTYPGQEKGQNTVTYSRRRKQVELALWEAGNKKAFLYSDVQGSLFQE